MPEKVNQGQAKASPLTCYSETAFPEIYMSLYCYADQTIDSLMTINELQAASIRLRVQIATSLFTNSSRILQS